MEKLNLQRDKEDFYILEVNDNGDTIEFDLTDINLPNKIIIASEKIANLNKEYQEEITKINNEKIDDIEKAKKTIEIENKMCQQMREQFDNFLGKNACQKIFGDVNYYGMFVQLFEALEPHFDKMKINVRKAKTKLVNKYIPKGNNVI